MATDTDMVKKATINKSTADTDATIKATINKNSEQSHSRPSALGYAFGMILTLVMSLISLFTGRTNPIIEPTAANANVACCTAYATWDATPNNNNFSAIADTGASQHYLHGKAPISNFNANGIPASVNIANGQTIQSTGHAKLLLPNLPPGSEDCHIMPSFTNNLLSMGKFCDAGCEVTFTATDVRVVDKTGTVILQGYREQTGAKMWRFNIHPDHPQAEAHNAATPNPHIIPPNIAHIIPPDIEPQSQQPPTRAAP